MELSICSPDNDNLLKVMTHNYLTLAPIFHLSHKALIMFLLLL